MCVCMAYIWRWRMVCYGVCMALGRRMVALGVRVVSLGVRCVYRSMTW